MKELKTIGLVIGGVLLVFFLIFMITTGDFKTRYEYSFDRPKGLEEYFWGSTTRTTAVVEDIDYFPGPDVKTGGCTLVLRPEGEEKTYRVRVSAPGGNCLWPVGSELPIYRICLSGWGEPFGLAEECPRTE